MKNYIELIPAPQIILEQRHGHWFRTTICMETSKSVVDLPTPPLPEATAIIFLTSGRISTPFCVEYLGMAIWLMKKIQ
jgi:hypothetical protein